MRPSPRGAVLGATLVSLVVAGVGAVPAQAANPSFPVIGTGPTTTVNPYVVPVTPAVGIASLLTVDDQPAGNGVGMTGTPDGLGATSQGEDLVVYMNHEYGADVGAVRAHGERGSYVSRNVVDPSSGAVLETTDLITRVRYWDYDARTWRYRPTSDSAAFNRFCSASLTDPGQLYDEATRRGLDEQVYFGNEEGGDDGRAFGVTADGTATQLPRLGKLSFENTLVASGTGATTVAISTEDNSDGQLRVYVGRKKRGGTLMQKAGLTNGRLHVVSLEDSSVSTDAGFRSAYGTGAEVDARVRRIRWNATGAEQNAQAARKGLQLTRIEDGAFDPSHPDDFYFLTTEGGDTADNPAEPGVARNGGGLWRLRFTDVSHPARGMTLTLLRDGSEAPYLSKPDNMDIDPHGHLLIQEDPGGNAHVARVLAYDIEGDQIATLAQFDPAIFSGPDALTTDEESSGILDVEDQLGTGRFLFDAQVHTSVGLSDPDTQVERGQLLTMTVDWDAVFPGR